MILRDRDRAVDPCCDNVVGTGFRWPSAIIFILCFVYFDHNGGSASTRCPRWPRSSTRTASLHGFTKCDSVNKVFFAAKRSFFSVKREMPILFFVNCERTVLFSVKREIDPPFTTLYYGQLWYRSLWTFEAFWLVQAINMMKRSEIALQLAKRIQPHNSAVSLTIL